VSVSELDDDFSPGKLIALKAAKPLMMPFLPNGFGAIFVFIMAVWLGVQRLRRTSCAIARLIIAGAFERLTESALSAPDCPEFGASKLFQAVDTNS
jgi:hypothetical protein